MIPKLSREVVSQIAEMLESMPLPVDVDGVDLNHECVEADWFRIGWQSAITLAVAGLEFKSKKQTENDGRDPSLN